MNPPDKLQDIGVAGTNFGKAASGYGTFRAGFPDSLFDRLSAFNIGLPGQHITDPGTGTGALARGFALRGCGVVGVDSDSRMLSQARALNAQVGIGVSYVHASAEDTGLDDSSTDVVTAGRCWHWFDRARAIREVRRILRRDGRLVIAHFDWLPFAGNMVEAT